MVWWSCQTEKTRGEKLQAWLSPGAQKAPPGSVVSPCICPTLCVGSILPKTLPSWQLASAFILVGFSPLEKRKYLFSDISPKVTVCLVLDHVVFLSQSLRPLNTTLHLARATLLLLGEWWGKASGSCQPKPQWPFEDKISPVQNPTSSEDLSLKSLTLTGVLTGEC